MLEVYNKLSIEALTCLYKDSEELFLATDKENNVIFFNTCALNLFGNIKNITEIEHFFSFNVCILDREKFFDYNPIQEAMNSRLFYRSETLFQIENNLYKNLNIRSFAVENFKIIIFSDITEKIKNDSLTELAGKNEILIEKLEKENKEVCELKEKAQTLAIRTGLINTVSNKIRNGFDIEEIISTAIEEISMTLGLSRSYYAQISKSNNELLTKHFWTQYKENPDEINNINPNENILIRNTFENRISNTSTLLIDDKKDDFRQQLITPIIYQNAVFGVMVFLHSSEKKQWHPEEISLVEGIASLLASAINQANLFNELEKQKSDLEKTLFELKQTQTQLIHSEKMASLGQLVAGVAHEINTPIGSINSNNEIFDKCIQKLKDNSGEQEKYLEIFEDTIKINSEAIKRINSIVKALKNFARLDEAEYKETDIHEGIKSTLMLLNHEIKGKIQIIEEFDKLPLINCYPNQLNQVFMNILVNACQSIEKNGIIKIKTENLSGKIRITISDTGKGIKSEHLKHIFDPGFTTKGVGVGTGLGLSICYQIIQKHDGTIKAENNSKKGSSFIIELPEKIKNN